MGYYRGDYYRGDCNYAAGDYYRGDILGIGKALKKVAGTVLKAGIGFATGGVGGAIAAVAGGPSRQLPQGPLAGFALPTIAGGFDPRTAGLQIGSSLVDPGTAPIGGVQQPVGTMLSSGFIPGCQLKGTRPNKSGYYKQVVKGDPTRVIYIPKKSVCVKSRRLNVANPRALRRAIRRAQGFAKLARRVMTFVSAKAPKGRAKFKRKR